MDTKKVIKSPEYGVAFRMEDYHQKQEQGNRASNKKTAQVQNNVIPAPIKTARRQQTDFEDILSKQNKPTVGPEIQAQRSYTDKWMVSTVASSVPIRETKLTASEISELVRRRLPASELYKKMENPPVEKPIPDKQLVIIQEPTPTTYTAVHNLNSDPCESNKKPINNSSPGWQFAKCMCCVISGCSLFTTALGLCILLCYEWSG
jgi:hypothetical protein